MIVDFREMAPGIRYQWMTQAIIPRPVAWMLTANDDGGLNAAPFSYFNALASAPALVGVSFGAREDGGSKDTLANVRRRGEFVVHVAAMAQLAAVNESAASLPYGESEVRKLGLEVAPFPAPAADFSLPMLAAAPVALACRRHSVVPLGLAQNLLIGEVLFLHARDEVLGTDAKGRVVIDAAKVDPVARLSAGWYAGLAEGVALRRPA